MRANEAAQTLTGNQAATGTQLHNRFLPPEKYCARRKRTRAQEGDWFLSKLRMTSTANDFDETAFCVMEIYSAST